MRIVLEMPEGPPYEPDDEPGTEPPQKSKGGWIWFWLVALLGLRLDMRAMVWPQPACGVVNARV